MMDSLISGAIGMIGGAMSDRRNYKNQTKLMGQQHQYNKEIGEINQGYEKEMAMINNQYALGMAKESHNMNKDMWNYSNYESQVAHMKAAGLNPALLYGNGGGGGATATGGTAIAGQGSAGSASGGTGPQAIKSQIVEGAGMGIQLGLMNAQKRNLEADAANKDVARLILINILFIIYRLFVDFFLLVLAQISHSFFLHSHCFLFEQFYHLSPFCRFLSLSACSNLSFILLTFIS